MIDRTWGSLAIPGVVFVIVAAVLFVGFAPIESTNTDQPEDTPGETVATDGDLEQTESGEITIEEVIFAERTIEQTELSSGESTTVSVDLRSAEPGSPAIFEAFNPAFETVEIRSADPAPEISAVRDANDELTVIWAEPETAAVEYEVTIPEDAESGDTFTITGEAETEAGAVPIGGDTQIEVVEENFEVSIIETNSPVKSGEILEVTTEIENTGDAEATQEIELDVEELGTDSGTVTLDGGESTSITLSVETQLGDAGDYTATVASENDHDRTEITVEEVPEEELVYWQVDFGEGEGPPMPPAYWPNDLMAALGNSAEGVSDNPANLRLNTDGQLGDVSIIDHEFHFDDESDPTNVTVEFELEEDAEERDLHLAAFILPGPFDEDEIDEQELFVFTSETYEGGDTGELTIPIPQAEDATE